MSNALNYGDENLLRRLRRMRILVIHPIDSEGQSLLAHLKRIGCRVDINWPAPSTLPDDVDVVLFLLSNQDDKSTLSWMASEESIARIAIISYETPEILSTLERLNVHGVLSKPLRMFGILAVLTTSIGLLKLENRLKTRIKTLDETLKTRRKIEQAVQILIETKGIEETEAYSRLRNKSKASNSSIVSIAEAIIASHDI